MGTHFEGTANIESWPKNVPGKPTHVAVFGLYHPDRGKTCEILWTGDFPDLQPAMYWAAKKEVEAVRKGGWYVASRVLWQHDLTPEQAVEACRKQVEPQMDRAIASAEAGDDPDPGDGPLKRVDPSKAEGYYVEAHTEDGVDLFKGFLPPGVFDDDDNDDGMTLNIPLDPRTK